MIIPSNYTDDITYEDALAGYLEDGFSQEDAEVYARILTQPTMPGFPIL